MIFLGPVLASVLAVLALASCAAGSPAAGRAAPSPSFVVFLVDDQGWSGTSVRMDPGDPTSASDFYRTPHLERLAREGLRFSRGYAPSPFCSPSRAAIQCGRSPARLHFTGNTNHALRQERLPQDELPLIQPTLLADLPRHHPTVAGWLQQRGYVTAHLGKWHLNGDPEQHPGLYGYDVHDGPTGNQAGGIKGRDGKAAARLPADDPKQILDLARRGAGFLAERKAAGEPFFLQISHYAMHDPIVATPSAQQRVAALPAGRRHDHRDYAAMTADVDDSLGTILEALDELELSDTTYVFYLSDNGAAPAVSSNAPLSGGKGSLREGGVRVPLLVRGPGVPANATCHRVAVAYDLFPTIADLVSGEVPAGLDGGSWREVFADPDGGVISRALPGVVFHQPHYPLGGPPRAPVIRGYPQSSLLQGRWKLTRTYHERPEAQLRLFDVEVDPREETSVASAHGERTRAMAALLQTYLEECEAQMPRPNPSYRPR